MTSFARLLAFLLLLLATTAGLGWLGTRWIQQQTLSLRAELIDSKQRELVAALDGQRSPPTAENLSRLGQSIGARIEFHAGEVHRRPPASPDNLVLYHRLLPEPINQSGPQEAIGTFVVHFPPSPGSRLMQARSQIILALILTGPAFVALLALALLFSQTRSGTRPPWSEPAATDRSLEHLARATVERTEALDRERSGRLRAEEDVELRQRLLSHSEEERTRLGRDLHDGIIQSLYAVGLTLQSVRSLGRESPAEADRRLASCVDTLNQTIRDVRAHIAGLSPEGIGHTEFSAALNRIVEELRAGRETAFELRLDEEAAGRLSAEQRANTLQIVREAISNSLRHGHATQLSVRLHRAGNDIALQVRDNGVGFNPDHRSGGHGLGNMRARAETLGGTLVVDSTPQTGTRVVLTFPAGADGA